MAPGTQTAIATNPGFVDPPNNPVCGSGFYVGWDASGDGHYICVKMNNPTNGTPGNGGGGGGGNTSTPFIWTLTPIPSLTPTVCVFGPPTADGYSWTPTNPLVLDQDPDRLGFTGSFLAHGGGGGVGCGARGLITGLAVSVRLSAGSIDWITHELILRYPGAHVLGTYPAVPLMTITGAGTSEAGGSFTFLAEDPGYYDIEVIVTQADGQTATVTFSQPVYLFESTIIK
jgi:hypothetical protein